MTLSLENLDSTMNKKYGTQTVLTYAQSFATSMKESVKRLIEWENHIKQESVSSSWKQNEPRRVKISQTKKKSSILPPDEKREMREWV